MCMYVVGVPVCMHGRVYVCARTHVAGVYMVGTHVFVCVCMWCVGGHHVGMHGMAWVW